jgi:hypothetical protein
MAFRRARPIEELIRDPRFPYHVGQLIGATEMAAWWMRTQGNEETQKMGGKLAEAVGWFFAEGTPEPAPPKRG